MDKNQRAVFISGGTSGIGLAIVKKYLNEGYFVVINHRIGGKNTSDVEIELLDSNYVRDEHYCFLKANVGAEAELTALFQKLPKNILESLEILINNAGMLKRGRILDLKQSDWIDIFNVNVFGIINLSKLVVKNCKNLKGIINIGSIRGEPAISRTNNVAYSISKSVIPTLTAVMAKSFGPVVRVNAIIPGTIDTPQRQGISKEEMRLYGENNAIIGRLGKPEEVAELCYFITSKGDYITGTSFIIDGGYSVNYIK